METKMYCLPSDQGTGTLETALCCDCYADKENQDYAREQASHTDDIDPNAEFVDCSGNEALKCCVCGVNIYGSYDDDDIDE